MEIVVIGIGWIGAVAARCLTHTGHDVYSAVADASAIILATEWPEFIEADWEKIKHAMAKPYTVIDGRNALPKDKMTAIGFKYIGVGRRVTIF